MKCTVIIYKAEYLQYIYRTNDNYNSYGVSIKLCPNAVFRMNFGHNITGTRYQKECWSIKCISSVMFYYITLNGSYYSAVRSLMQYPYSEINKYRDRPTGSTAVDHVL